MENWGRDQPKQCCNVMVEAPNPHWIYIKHLSTLICCEWAYGSTLIFLCLCRLGMNFRKIGVGLSPSDVVI